MAARTARGRLSAIALPRVDLRLVAGLLLVAIAVAGGLALWRQLQVTVPVVAAARDVPPGHVIAREDLLLTQARLEGPLAALVIGTAELDALVGRTATERLHSGALVIRPALGDGPVIGPNDVAATVPVKVDAVYAHLRRGDAVAVMATSERGKPQSVTVTLLERAIVYDVGTEATRVSLGPRARTPRANRGGLRHVARRNPEKGAIVRGHHRAARGRPRAGRRRRSRQGGVKRACGLPRAERRLLGVPRGPGGGGDSIARGEDVAPGCALCATTVVIT